MLTSRERHPAVVIVTVLTVAASALLGCTATTEQADDQTPPVDASAATPSPSAIPTQTATPGPTTPAEPDFPDVTADEVARSTHDGTVEPPVTDSVIERELVSDRRFSIEAACDGDQFGYVITTADVDEPGQTLVEATMACVDDVSVGSFEVPHGGPVQIMITETSTVSSAWVRVVQSWDGTVQS